MVEQQLQRQPNEGMIWLYTDEEASLIATGVIAQKRVTPGYIA